MNQKRTNQLTKYKAVIIDVDGTLVEFFNDLPSKRVTSALNKASKKIHIGLATSRPLIYAKHIVEHLSLSGPSIFSNGAEIVDTTTQKILAENPIEKDAVEKVAELLEKEHLEALINEDGTDEDFKKGKAYKRPLDIWFPTVPEEKLERCRNFLRTIPNIYFWDGISKKGGFDIVVTHTAATKQHGIFEVAKILGIQTHEIIGIGDGYNDFPLLMACGLKVAMDNAVEDLKKIADFIAPPVTKDGVAVVLEKFVL